MMKVYRMWLLPLLVLTLASLVAGCAPFGPVLGEQDPDPGSGPVELDGTLWTLIEMNGAPVADRGLATLDFDEGEVRGIGFCNSFFAPYEQEGEELSIGQIGQTLMACEDMDPEMEYFQTLANVASSRIEDGKLLLLDEAQTAVLVYEPAEHAALEGTTWVLTSIQTGSDSMSSPIWGAEATAIVEDGAIGGTTGCNSYSGEFAVDGANIEIGELIQTEMYCTEPEGVMEQEADYLEALSRAGSYEIVRERLTLFDAEGTPLLTYTVAAE